MAVQIPFPLPATGYALNSKVRINLDFLVEQFNQFNSGSATWDTVAVGTANSLTGVITLYNSSNANYLSIRAGATSPSITYTLPTADGAANTFLKTNGSGTLSFAYPIAAGLAGYLAMYDGAVIGASSQDLEAYKTFNGNLLRVAIADHGALGSTRTYTIPNAGASASFIMSEGSASITGSLTIVEPNNIRTSKLQLFNGVTVEFQVATGGSGHELKFPSSQGGASTVLTNDGSGNLSWLAPGSSGAATQALDNLAAVAINTSLVSDTDNTDDLGTSAKEWATVYARTYIAGKSGAPGAIQIFPVTASKGSISIECANNTTDHILHITNAALNGSSRTWTIPNISADGTFAALEGTQTFTGAKTFSSAVSITATSNHIVLSTSSNTLTISANAQATSARTWSIPDISANGTFAALEGTQTFTGNKTFSGTVDVSGLLKGKGTTTNDSAAAGYIGEIISASNASATSFPTSGTYGDANSISLTAGDWDVSFNVEADNTGGTATWSRVDIGVSATSGNDTTGLNLGDNFLLQSWANSATTPTRISITIASFRVSLSGTTTYYGKVRADYTAGTPRYYYRLSARRVR